MVLLWSLLNLFDCFHVVNWIHLAKTQSADQIPLKSQASIRLNHSAVVDSMSHSTTPYTRTHSPPSFFSNGMAFRFSCTTHTKKPTNISILIDFPCSSFSLSNVSIFMRIEKRQALLAFGVGQKSYYNKELRNGNWHINTSSTIWHKGTQQIHIRKKSNIFYAFCIQIHVRNRVYDFRQHHTFIHVVEHILDAMNEDLQKEINQSTANVCEFETRNLNVCVNIATTDNPGNR